MLGTGPSFFSLVVPCYKVARFLPDFLASLDQQFLSFRDFEVVFVVDGCPEQSEEIIARWQDTTSCASQLIVTENRGVSAARNTGLERATGEWVSFPDPDDELAPGYLQEVAARLAEVDDVALVSTRMVKTDADVTRVFNHALDYRFAEGTRVANLEEEPTYLQLSSGTAFFQRDLIVKSDLKFDSRLKIFEDGKFVASYLLQFPSPTVLVCADAHYYYKTREDGSGALSSSSGDFVNRYLTNIPKAHLELLAAAGKQPPQWLQYVILYELYWLFAATFRLRDQIHGAPAALLAKLSEMVRVLLRELSYESLRAFNVVKVRPEIRAAWIIGHFGYIPRRWVRQYRYDRSDELLEYRYFTAQDGLEDSVIDADGKELQPAFQKWRAVMLFGEPWFFERILWIPAREGTVFQALEGGRQQFANEGMAASDREFLDIFEWLPPRRQPVWQVPGLPTSHSSSSRIRRVLRPRWKKLRNRIVNTAALLPQLRTGNRNIWVLMDRDTQANDNAEALYRYLRRERPHVNARFVLRKSSPDFPRLAREGFKLVPYGSVRHFVAMRAASHLVSSHIDEYVVRPFKKLGLRKTWNYTFLQHGVTNYDISRWLNTKDVQLLVTATEPEARAFRDDGSPYVFSAKEVVLTGFPRHDRLAEAMENGRLVGEKRTLLIMPTWRSYLLADPERAGNDRDALDEFSNSEYVRQWTAVLNDPRLHGLAESAGLEVVLLPHPNLQPHLANMTIPSSVRIESYGEGSIAPLLAEAAVTMTDYSSQAFEGAYCFAPCIYFQFDREVFFGGMHIGSPGYFDVRRDGFGPVVDSVDGVVAGLEELLDPSNAGTQEYKERIEALYPMRDGKASERVYLELARLKERR